MAGGVPAQEPGALPTGAAPSTLDPAEVVSPGGAFLRALVVPGWGHAAIGEPTRGGFYFATQSATGWMLARTTLRLNAAKRVRDLRLEEVRATLVGAGTTDEREIALAQQDDPGVEAAQGLVDARSQQFEDWLALGIFVVFLSGADAFVSAHLRDFPDPVRVGLDAGAGRVELRISLSQGRGPR